MTRNIGPIAKVMDSIPPRSWWPDLLYQAYASPPGNVGFRICDSFGRSFRLCHTTEVAAVGNMLSHLVTEVAIAATKFDITAIGASVIDADATIVANAWDGGMLCIEDGTSAGALYPIVSNTLGTAGTIDSDISIEGELHTPLSESSVGFLIHGPFENLSVANAANPAVEMPVGRAMWTSSSDSPYIWVQTWGLALLKAGTGAVGAGDTVGLAEDDAGSIETLVTTEDPAYVGVSLQAIADGEWGLCNIHCYP